MIRPSGISGDSAAIFESDVSRGHWSVSTTVPSGSVTGSISSLNRPSAIAARARSWETSANDSISSRERPHFSAISSAARNWLTSWSPYLASQPGDSANGVENPYCWPTSIADEIGIALMFCTPPATTRSWVPESTPWAAKCTACWAEPHWRSMVTPGTWSGSPATSHAVRATSPACEPIVSQQPRITSSTAPGSTPVRRIRAAIECAPRSAEWTPASAPPRLPTGVRTASTM